MFPGEAFQLFCCSVKGGLLGLEEHVDILHVLGGIQKFVLLCDETVEQSHAVAFSAEDIPHQVPRFCDGLPLGIAASAVEVRQKSIKVGEPRLKGIHHKLGQSGLVAGDAHGAGVVPEKAHALTDQVLRGGDVPYDSGLVNLGPAPEEVREPAVISGDVGAAVADDDLLPGNEPGDEDRNVDLPPAVGDGGVPALDVTYGDADHPGGLEFQPLADLVEGLLVVCTCAGDNSRFAAVQSLHNVLVAFRKAGDLVEAGVDAVHEICQGGIQLVPGAGSPDIRLLAVNVDSRLDNRRLYPLPGFVFQSPGFPLPSADDFLDALGQVDNIPLFHVLVDLQGQFQTFVVVFAAVQDQDRLVVDLGLHHKPPGVCPAPVAGHGDDAEPHAAAG